VYSVLPGGLGKNMRNNLLSGKLKYFLWLFGLLIALFLVLCPLYLLLKYAVSDSASINTGGMPIPLWPYHPTLKTFSYLFSDKQFYTVILNSVIIAAGTVTLSMILGIPAAWVLGRYRFRGLKFIMIGLISIRLFPDISSIIPIAELFVRYNLSNTFAGIILAHTLLALPYVIFIGMSAFEVIPSDLEQQARVMGANRFRIFSRILLPIAAPGLAAAAIYTFLLSWDEFIFSYFLLGLGKITTLTLYLKQKLSYSPPQNILATISVCLTLPVIAFTLLMQKYMTAGITTGSVK
jgi:ABC-type glycerol-3-phosphate transport system permease component